MQASDSTGIDRGQCVCGGSLTPDCYRTRDHFQLAYFSGLCSSCLDAAFLSTDEDGERSHPIREGVLLAVQAPGMPPELSLFPFRFVIHATRPSVARLVWEAHSIIRAGPWMAGIDLAYELQPMQDQLVGHQLRTREYRDFDAPEVLECLADLALLIALDRRTLGTASRICNLPHDAFKASFDEVPWIECVGRSLRSLGLPWKPEATPHSSLRSCALMGHLLMKRGHAGVRPLDHLLASRFK